MITIAIPHKGRSLEQVLDKFVSIKVVSEDEKNSIVNVIQIDKKRISKEKNQIRSCSRLNYSSINEVELNLRKLQNKFHMAHYLSCDYDYHRAGKPARILFRGLDTEIEGIPVRLIGKSHYDIPTALKNHIVQLGFVGWDELYADHIEHLTNDNVREWSAMNQFLSEGSTDVRILGSAGIRDYTGHFLILDDSIGQKIWQISYDKENSIIPRIFDGDPELDIKNGEGGCVYVDHKYQKIYEKLLGHWTTEFKGSNDVEEDIRQNKGVGIYVVQTGSTLKKSGLHIVGQPLLVSETVIAANVDDMKDNSDAIKVARDLEPQSQMRGLYSRVEHELWIASLTGNLGKNFHYRGFGDPEYRPGHEHTADLTLHERSAQTEPVLLL